MIPSKAVSSADVIEARYMRACDLDQPIDRSMRLRRSPSNPNRKNTLYRTNNDAVAYSLAHITDNGV